MLLLLVKGDVRVNVLEVRDITKKTWKKRNYQRYKL